MGRVHLKVYQAPEDDLAGDESRDAADEPVSIRLPASHFSQARISRARKTVTVPLSDVAAVLADAVASRRTWIRDFDDDEITLSADFYEVLLAYQRMRRPSA